MTSTVTSLGDLAAHTRRLWGPEAGAAPGGPDREHLLACPPTAFCRARAASARREADDCPEGTVQRMVAERRWASWTRMVGICEMRDAALADRRALGAEYEGCICLGLGGDGERMVPSIEVPGRRLVAVTDEQGRPILTWGRICGCPDGLAHRAELARARGGSAARYRARRVAALAGAAEIPRAYDGLSVESWDERASAVVASGGGSPSSVRAVLDAVLRWGRLVSGPAAQPTCLLLLAGNHGTGKSGLAAVLARAWVEQERSVLFRSVARVAADLRAAPYRRRDDDEGGTPTEGELLAAYAECELLVLDDLGAEALVASDGERLRERVFLILDQRLSECRPTIVVTNLTRDGLEARWGARLADRLGSGATAVRAVFATPNLREASW